MYLWMPEILNEVAIFNDENPGLPASICDAYAVKTPEITANVTTAPEHQVEHHCHLDTSVFINTMITGGASLVVYLSVGFIVGRISKKTIISKHFLTNYYKHVNFFFSRRLSINVSLQFTVIAQMISGLAGIGLLFVKSMPLIATMIIIYHVISGVCLSLLNSIVVDLYPTNLR